MRATLWEELRHSLALHAQRVALQMGGVTVTYAQLDAWSSEVARQICSLGVERGDPVALYLRNGLEFVVCDVAIARMGAVKVPINYMLPRETIAYMVEQAAAKAVVFDATLARANELNFEHQIRLVVGELEGFSANSEGLVDLPHVSGVAPFGDGAVDASATAAVYFTGGTTGKPKGVVHTQASTVALHYAQMLEAEITDSERLLLMTPLAHAAGLFTQSALIRGATVVLTDGFDAKEMVELLERETITWTFLVPTMIYRLLDQLAQASSSTSLRTVVYGAAPISPERLREALEVLGPVFVQLYGQTECPNWGTKLAKEDHRLTNADLLASCGKASIFADVKVVDDVGAELTRGEIGEICLRSPYTMKEYLLDPKSTEEKFLGSFIRTGDVGVMDESGYVYLLDRKNDMIITGGMNVYCREVEDVMSQHPHVRHVAVIGIPHADWGESVHAVVVCSGPIGDRELIAWSKARLAAYAAPKSVEFVEVLPETPFGKIDKKALRAPYWSGTSRSIG